MDDGENVYRMCRLRAKERDKEHGKERFGSSEKSAMTLGAELESDAGREGADRCHVSHASLKDYESGETVPTPETVKLMADVYGTPELKWLHCSYSCPLGREIARTDKDIGSEDVYHTYFDLVGAFDKIDGIEESLHKVIEDEKLADDEGPVIDDILKVLDDITESAKNLKVWVEGQRNSKKD